MKVTEPAQIGLPPSPMPVCGASSSAAFTLQKFENVSKVGATSWARNTTFQDVIDNRSHPVSLAV
jgi:hypothetical protein